MSGYDLLECIWLVRGISSYNSYKKRHREVGSKRFQISQGPKDCQDSHELFKISKTLYRHQKFRILTSARKQKDQTEAPNFLKTLEPSQSAQVSGCLTLLETCNLHKGVSKFSTVADL